MPDVSFVTLHSRQDLFSRSIMFLNQEWPRSYASREHSQRKSCRESPPMSFLLIDEKANEILGHLRLTHLPNRENALWIESVMIREDQRGKGLGKRIMKEAENWMVENGFDQAFLCTEDQCRFYESIGYVKCDPITHSTTATTVFAAMSEIQKLMSTDALTTPKKSPASEKTASSETIRSGSTSVPPPPPPPPKTMSVSTSPININLVDEQYMTKRLKPIE